MKTLLRDADGESLIWWNWQNLAKPGQRRNARAWLFFYDNTIGVQWVFRPRNLSIGLTLADTTVDDDSLSFHFSIPFLLALYVSISRLPIVKRLPGVKYVSGSMIVECDLSTSLTTGERTTGFTGVCGAIRTSGIPETGGTVGCLLMM